MTTSPSIWDRLTQAQLAVLSREYLLAGQLIDRAGMPHAISKFGREIMAEIAIDEWMGASPVYTRRIQRLLGFGGEDVGTIFKGMQFDVGAPHEFLDFRYRVHDDDHGEFWLNFCGALADVEPMGDDYVTAMCHHIEDPTFDATACASNPRARMTPVHRPPRVPAGRHPNCHWNVDIVHDATPLTEPTQAIRMAQTSAAQLPLPVVEETDDGLSDYVRPIDPDLQFEHMSSGLLRAACDEFALQGHLLVLSFGASVADRSNVETAQAMIADQFVGVAGVVAQRLLRMIRRHGLVESGALRGPNPDSSATTLAEVATVFELHPAFRPLNYVGVYVEVLDECVRVQLGGGPAADEDGTGELAAGGWVHALQAGDARAIEAMARAVSPTAECRLIDSSVAPSWEIRLGDVAHPVASQVTLTEFSTGATFEFSTP